MFFGGGDVESGRKSAWLDEVLGNLSLLKSAGFGCRW